MKLRSSFQFIISLSLTCFLLISAPLSVAAAKVELSTTMKKAFDKITAAATTEQANQLRTTYQLLLSNQEKGLQYDARMKTMNTQNDAAERTLKQQIKEIDAAKLSDLTKQLQQSRDRYAPLYATYTSLKKQLTAIRKLKNKELTSAFQVQVEAAKLLAELAKEDVRRKDRALQTAKSQTAATVKRIRDTIAETEAIEQKIRAERIAVIALNKLTSSLQQNLHAAIKTSEPKATMQALSTQNAHIDKLNNHKQRIIQCTTDIEKVIRRAAALVPMNKR